jgi:uncharacterized protein (TIGR00159 family)
MGFLNFRFVDFIDILVFSFILYQIYMLIRGTVAIKIFIGILSLYLLWVLVKALHMELLSSILGQLTGVGVVAILIVFQQEIRKFFLQIGSNYLSENKFSLEQMFRFIIKPEPIVDIYPIIHASLQMSREKTGALIVIERDSDLQSYLKSGTILDAKCSSQLLLTIFFKNSALHDGAVIIKKDRIHAAGCVLPVSGSTELAEHFGLRHRSALGISERTDAIVVVVSEERGSISVFYDTVVVENAKPMELKRLLKELFAGQDAKFDYKKELKVYWHKNLEKFRKTLTSFSNE